MEQKTDYLAGLKRLREPFEPSQISTLPKPYKKDSPKGKCAECGGWHGLPAVHLSYVGHAALTDRLLEVDPLWNWEPVAVDAMGSPALDRDGGMWIRLTVCGVTRLGYGDAQGKQGGDATKERIGDALRNAAMRFGCALDLWHKGGDLHPDDESEPKAESKPAKPAAPAASVVTASQVKPEPKSVAADLAAISNAKSKPVRFAALMAAQKKYPEGTPERKAVQELYAAVSKATTKAEEQHPPEEEPPPYADGAPTDDNIPF